MRHNLDSAIELICLCKISEVLLWFHLISSVETTLVSFGALSCHNYMLFLQGVQFSLWHFKFYTIAREISILLCSN